MNQEMLRKGVRLYYLILTVHRQKLPGKMRMLGDLYVKQEFRQHHSNPQSHYYEQFYEKWLMYYKQLENEGFPGVAKPMNQNEEGLLNTDQK